MRLPDRPHIEAHHLVHGGLWKVIPPRNGARQPRPFFVSLGVIRERLTYDQGDLATTVEGSPWLRAAEWIPVDARGNEVGAVEIREVN